MKAFDDFIERHGLTADIVQVPANPYMGAPLSNQRHYHVTVKKPGEGNSIQTYYSVGRCFVNDEAKQQVMSHPKTVYEQEENARVIAKYGAPKLHDVLSTIALNASVLDFPDFEEWAVELGFDPDSRRAEWVYNITRREAKAFLKFFGAMVFDELRNLKGD